MSISKVTFCYISTACNRTPHAADWGNNGLICYGSCHAVSIYNPNEGDGGRVVHTLTAHKGRVNSTKWVRQGSFPETELLSVAADNCGLIWSKSNKSFVVTSVLKGHDASVTAVDSVYQPDAGDEKLLVVTASVDSTVRVWERKNCEEAVCRQVIELNSGVCVSLRLTLPARSSACLLACALDDSNIHLYTTQETSKFGKQLILRGHEDWVTALDFTQEGKDSILLASGSQDATVRLWRFHSDSSGEKKVGEGSQLFHVEEKPLTLGSTKLRVGVESVLLGHDGRVYGVRWNPSLNTKTGDIQPLKLLTSSLDKTVVIWSPEEQSGVWLEETRMGEVGGNTLGFFGACFDPSGDRVLAHGYQGGFHIWHKQKDGWHPKVVIGGHFDTVSDLAWEPHYGRYLVTVSTDQTTRLHAPWIKPNSSKGPTWHEIARPQVHGYDLICLAMLPGFRFASGADEKVVRAFTAPQNFLENFKRLCTINDKDEEDIDKNLILPTGASVPVLGLSNKAVFQNEVEKQPVEKHVRDQYDENSYFTPQHLKEPPTEDNLLQNTLWPETMKLYGHGYEIFSLAATSDGKLLASACKATSEAHAAILLWDTKNWQKVGNLVAHQLTITQMQFSPDDEYLLSVSRDRRWSLFRRSDSVSEKYKLIAKSDKTTGIHSRIIWCCAWNHDSKHFATGSRDGKVVIWGQSSHETLGKFGPSSEFLDLPKESITSLAFAPVLIPSTKEYLIAIGSEFGEIRLYGWEQQAVSPWRFLYQLSGESAHHLSVKRLAFRPVRGRAGHTDYTTDPEQSDLVLQLASCGLDHAVKICDICITCNKT